jgi:hypothetical protein
MQSKKHICRIPMQFSQSPAKIMNIAAELGRAAGLAKDWVPKSFADALFEIVVVSGDPAADGVHVLPSSALGRDDIFELRVHVEAGWNINAVCEDYRKRSGIPGGDLDETIALILMDKDSAIEHGIEIHSIEAPTSQHAVIAELQAAEAARTDLR